MGVPMIPRPMNPMLAMNCAPFLGFWIGSKDDDQRYGASHARPAVVVVAGLYSQPIQPS